MNIQLKGIQKKYGDKTVLNEINLTLTSKLTTILGESGCGKTTLLKLIAGLIEPDAGEIMFGSKKIFSKMDKVNLPPNQRDIAMVFQDFALWPHMTVFENVAYSLTGKKQHITEQVMAALELVDLENFAARKPSELSGGQQQRVSLARAIAPQPKVILFDEALSALDAVLREKMQIEIVNLMNQIDSQAIFVTHDQKEAMSMSDEIIVMTQGSVGQLGLPQTIYREPANQYIANFVGKMNQVRDEYFIRPEHIQTTALTKWDIKRTMLVKKNQYIGERYIIHGEVNHFSWQFYSEEPLIEGSECQLYFNEKNLKKIGR